jgi:hypothetical protein
VAAPKTPAGKRRQSEQQSPPPADETPAAIEQPNAAEGSSAGSSAAAGTSGPFIGDAGPAHEPGAEQPAAGPELGTLHALPAPLPEWKPERVAQLLRAQGAATHALIGVSDRDWLWLAHELDATAEPLAAVLNKHAPTRAAAGVSDELAAAIGLWGYAGRSIRERVNELERRKAAEPPPAPVTGYDAGGERVETEPPPAPPAVNPNDVEWRTPE